ncbi:radical SAM protein [Pelagibius litoralis]|uniref:Radical SAM protein n=1 Tax=Pelagibius litoralis TaxID=374515 RepID=A0A967C4N7_9PROT|nr:radical SAM protein [Pelagibius litoralis]NIA68740.1 radical SAM protein [Pelagibius litoralis]
MTSETRIFLADLAHTCSVTDRSLTVPLGIGYIKAHCDATFGDGVAISLFKHPERLLAAAQAEHPDVFGFANYGWNENLNLEIGRHIRETFPDALIVAGGPNVDPEDALRLRFLKKHSYIDFLVIDGGEEPFAELIEWHRTAGGDYGKLPNNLVWRDGDTLHGTAERKLKKVIEGIQSPYLNGDLDEFLAAGMVPLFETNRGCPFRCTFCAWGSASKDLVRRLDLDQALAEIAYVGERSSARNWIVCDANFGLLPRDIELAKAIRQVKDDYGHPEKCHIWLAKNVTDRNLEIGGILGDMIVPVMAVQSLDEQVLEHIKRDNISTETYKAYQQKFHRMGSRTYSDMIVPLPGETLESHLLGLQALMGLGVDIIQNHNMRLLAGAETNSTETRDKFKFSTRYRLIHGDAGLYRAADGKEIRVFEYEESLRSTDTMSEEDLFYLRKLHFLVDFCWNTQVYSPLLRLGLSYDINPVDVLKKVLSDVDEGKRPALGSFFAEFERQSHDEWFDSAEQIESHFAAPKQFSRLLNQEFEKLNIHFSVIALRDYKDAFDTAIADILGDFGLIPSETLANNAKLCFAQFPSLSSAPPDRPIEVPCDLPRRENSAQETIVSDDGQRAIYLVETAARRELREMITAAQGVTLSKILNTQGISLHDLRLEVREDNAVGQAVRWAADMPARRRPQSHGPQPAVQPGTIAKPQSDSGAPSRRDASLSNLPGT